jgi:hypothetical protein
VLLASMALSACRVQSISVNGQNVAQNVEKLQNAPQGAVSSGTPIPLATTLSAARTMFQTRAPVTLNISSQTLTPGATLSLADTTTGQMLVKEAVPSPGTGTAATSYALTSEPYHLLLTLYPLDKNLAGKIAYGVNTLQLSIDEEVAEGTSQSQITLQDFPYSGLTTTSFSSGAQIQAGLQGHMALISGAVESNGSGTLTVGPVGVLND